MTQKRRPLSALLSGQKPLIFPEFEYYIDDDAYASHLLDIDLFTDNAHQVEELTRYFVKDMRQNKSVIGSIDDMLHSYGLDTQEGLALMALAEALLRIPDQETANQLIESKLREIDIGHLPQNNLFIRAMSWGMGVAQKIVKQDDDPQSFIQRAIRKLGIPSIRNATYFIVKIMSGTFILGQTISKALDNREAGLYYSFDMLGEGARDKMAAEKYFSLYSEAIENVKAFNIGKDFHECQSVSIKISALHPKFYPQFKERFFTEIYDVLNKLVSKAHESNVPVTIDAEEANRLEFTIALFSQLVREPAYKGWNGIGIVIQAYQKRAMSVIDYVIDLARETKRIIPVRLVKGAYWDSEIKHAQENGLDDFPVFTRKPLTDLNYIHCAKKLFDHRDYVFPQTATHNALTIAQLIHLAGDGKNWELQRLHGMGEELYESVYSHYPQLRQRVYAPVGRYEELLSYLVRRLLENGANSSFVNAINKEDVPVEAFLRRPKTVLTSKQSMRHPDVRLPKEICQTHLNSKGYEVGYHKDYLFLRDAVQSIPYFDMVLTTDYSDAENAQRAIRSPIDGRVLGHIIESSVKTTEAAIEKAHDYFYEWRKTTVEYRTGLFDTIATQLQERMAEFIALLVYEAGKNIEDAVADIREAIDFCRYYAAEARAKLTEPTHLPGPNGERNVHFYAARGVFACISPWNFPIAIFLGQISAALLTGNTVVAKPAEQTPILSIKLVELLYECGLPKDALHLVLGDAKVGSCLTGHKKIAGIAFTGSTEVSQIIYRQMAASHLAIRPIIAETGGLNAMVVDSTALLEQVTDDVLMSAFRSAGQRCSALRLLLVQEDVAENLIGMLSRAASEMVVGNPADIATEIGPVIDKEAFEKIKNYIDDNENKIIFNGNTDLPEQLNEKGYYVVPTIIKLDDIQDFNQEIFGPILHILPYASDKLDDILIALDHKGYGLTLGVHSRIPEFAQSVAYFMRAGNVYINRNIIGAIVGSQPFGGYGLSGTGPKAGGPEYLTRFLYERVISTNIAAAGGDPELMVIPNE